MFKTPNFSHSLKSISMIFSAGLMLSSCGTKEREGFVPAETAAKIYEISSIKDISNESAGAIHAQDASFKSEVAARGVQVETVVISPRLKALATNVKDKTVAESLAKAHFAFAIVDKELHVYRVETETSITNIDRDKSVSVKTLRVDRAITESKDIQKSDELQRMKEKLRTEEGGQQKEIRLVRVNRFAIEKFGVLGHNRTDFGEKKSSMDVQETDRAVATHLVLGDAVEEKADDKAAEKKEQSAQQQQPKQQIPVPAAQQNGGVATSVAPVAPTAPVAPVAPVAPTAPAEVTR